ncbi:MAG: hypothetical protein AB9903_12870 [Vulcanimicrobiota bacterium]
MNWIPIATAILTAVITGIVTYSIQIKLGEKVKAEIARETQKFSKLHDLRTQAIIEIYGELSKIKRLIGDAVCGFGSGDKAKDSEKIPKAMEELKSFYWFSLSKAILFDKKIVEKFDILFDRGYKILINYSQRDVDPQKGFDAWDDLKKNTFAPVMEDLEKEFQKIMGIEI